ncbi:MAG: site-2 protease family protein [Clostridium sp.]|nr:MAG: site-2 protease family protein [Clostridium sp.]
MIFKTLKILLFPSGIRQVGVSNLSGVVGIFSMVDSYIQYGILPLLALVALLSINIGVMNLLPIPALDGGRIVFLLYEAITRKKPNKKFENILNNIMFIFINDIVCLCNIQ